MAFTNQQYNTELAQTTSQVSPYTDPKTPRTPGYRFGNPQPPVQPGSQIPDPVPTPVPAPGTSPGAPSPTGSYQPGATRSMNDQEIGSWLASYAGQPGINPSVGGDPAYWIRRIKETQGLGSDNAEYWVGLMKRPEGAPEGGVGSQGPMVTPNGGIPPGFGQGTPFASQAGLMGQQDQLMGQLMGSPMYDQNWINQQNETQKEMISTAGQEGLKRADQLAASRGVYGGGTAGASRERLQDSIMRQHLQSQRDVSLKAQSGNRQSLMDALMASAGITNQRGRLNLDTQMGNSDLYNQWLRIILGGGL